MPWSIITAGWLGVPAWLLRLLAGAAVLRVGPAVVALAVVGALTLGCGSGLLLGSRTRGRHGRGPATGGRHPTNGAAQASAPASSATPSSGS